jgi:hypothetical protein
MDGTIISMILMVSIGLNVYLFVIAIPKLQRYNAAYILQYLKAVLLTLKRIKYKVPENTLDRLINNIETEINNIETFKDADS